MGVLEIIAEKELGSSLLNRRANLRRSLARLDQKALRPKSKKEQSAEKERIASIVDLCFAYEREEDPAERENILRTLEEIAGNETVHVPTETLEQFESQLVKTEPHYAQAEKADRQRSEEFLKKYSSLKARVGLATQEDVAKKSGLSRSYIAVIESGEHKPQHKTLQKLAKAFGVDVSEFF